MGTEVGRTELEPGYDTGARTGGEVMGAADDDEDGAGTGRSVTGRVTYS
eukprot:CAMPEP_0194336554 /NCGR_PEP_ID=MMETSP0171-20130528/73352_1 /TAXON_ID=218684 /ORGANISM="Corethron pennatum, Strain L29A3" /LENGTH=48 /DNA_ID= /DNA_START= /DNA_END= /DNA_ORIENTATION=